MSHVSVVIPALNESANIAEVIASIPVDRLRRAGHQVEILIVDNGSIDGTADVAQDCGARVVVQPIRGYGSAYKAGFANCLGDVIATGDADRTYPFDLLPELLDTLETSNLQFLSTNRLESLDPEAMVKSHVWGNLTLSAVSRALFGVPFRDSQSGMWILRRDVVDRVKCLSNGMAFSQELKHEAFARGFRCGEVTIPYRPRGGEKKLRTVRDGARNAAQLFTHRLRVAVRSESYLSPLDPAADEANTKVLSLFDPSPTIDLRDSETPASTDLLRANG